jgi:endonuclease/exonuclease/phosphatase (EEP) superfamily protein YafD
VHFASPREGLNAARHEGLDGIDDWRRNYGSRLTQAHALAADMRHALRPLIVAGDLNAPVSSPVLRSLLDTGLRDAHSSVGRGFGYSYGHDLRPGFSFLRIDHILVSADVGLAGTHVGGRTASEHRPVIADLLLRRPGVSADPAPRPAG